MKADCGSTEMVTMTIADGRVRLPFPTSAHMLVGAIDTAGHITASGFWMGLRNRVVDIHMAGDVIGDVFAGRAKDGYCDFPVILKKVVMIPDRFASALVAINGISSGR